MSKTQAGERGILTTVIPCISASGNLLPPFLIFKGERMSEKLRKDAPESFGLSCIKFGYIDSATFVKFLHHFCKHREVILGVPQISYIFLDVHASHCSYDALKFCTENAIELICIPPHCSHRLQPLDTHFNMPLRRE